MNRQARHLQVEFVDKRSWHAGGLNDVVWVRAPIHLEGLPQRVDYTF